MERLKYKLGFFGCLAVSCKRRSGRIALYWKKHFRVEDQSFSKSHVHAKVTEEGVNGDLWWLIGFYGGLEVSRRSESWSLLRFLKIPSDIGWVLLGDFNEIMSNDENNGGRAKPDRQLKDFRDVIEECQVHDLGFIGNPFTWYNGREEGHMISEWNSLYPMVVVIHGVVAYYDHMPIILKLFEGVQSGPRRKLFHFEAMWVEASGCKQVVDGAWKAVEGRRELNTIMKKIEHCSEKLSVWNRSSFGNVQRNLHKAKEKLRLAHQADPFSLNRQQIQMARNAVQQWLQRSETMWKQRSKVLWLAEGDKNSCFFHYKAS
ncbi:uncharacterized protein LOC122282326 [Carya illinoinensis]|uniref:uncharacterized protein LOC122282326 n=1 Tax=Carya illinoinensis TaxID=32201 RepID=UPI001C719C0C|nr:uncharacterized protein LOC122282326 [Carya illinoinensis]